jgi:hypothetical protein
MLIDQAGSIPPGVILNSFRLRYPTGKPVQYINLLERRWKTPPSVVGEHLELRAQHARTPPQS